MADEEAFAVIVGVNEPAGDAVGTVADDFAGLRFEDVHAVDFDAQFAIGLREKVDVWLAEDDEEVALTRILEVL